MTSTTAQRTRTPQEDTFPTEWALSQAYERNGGPQIQQSEDVRPEGRAPAPFSGRWGSGGLEAGAKTPPATQHVPGSSGGAE
jgi:hypothetical protein